MIKNLIIVGLAVVVFNMEVSRQIAVETRSKMHQESIDTLEDMVEWMENDIEEGEIRAELGITYIVNLEGTVLDLIAQ